ncbi:MAG: ATP-binding protein [Bacteroides sp.]|nr:ATP-binding protein [Roseburia sp.]MCM1346084.1 ATP-binding protein [Bacteroides sp.]MCM1420422.1 ATP-binding protein [Bacteroides sp.]
MRRLLVVIVLFVVRCSLVESQVYRNITTSEGLNNNNVYSIAQDKNGFVWFLSSGGVDRFDGLDFIHIPLRAVHRPVGFSSAYHLVADNNGNIWQVGTTESKSICCYNKETGVFDYIPLSGLKKKGVCFLFLDEHNRIWMSNEDKLFLYDIENKKQIDLLIQPDSDIVCGIATGNNKYVIGTKRGLIIVENNGDTWRSKRLDGTITWRRQDVKNDVTTVDIPSSVCGIATEHLEVDKNTGDLLVFDEKSRYYKVDIQSGKTDAYISSLIYDIHITDIQHFLDTSDCLLIATEGRGVFRLDMSTCSIDKFLQYGTNDEPGLRGNVVMSLFPDTDNKRIWLANYPYGICCYNMAFPTFERNVHTRGVSQSLLPGIVRAMLEDSEGDIWYVTSSGISCHNVKTGGWRHYLNDNEHYSPIFLSICEAHPGLIVVAGLMSGSIFIDKATGDYKIISPKYFGIDANSARGIRSIYKDANGILWFAGEKKLVRMDWDNRKYKSYPLTSNSVLIARKDEGHFWLATLDGLYVVDIHDGSRTKYPLPDICLDINAVLTTQNGDLYIGTTDAGLFVQKAEDAGNNMKFDNYICANSALLSNNILSLTEDSTQTVIMSTDHGISRFYPEKKSFSNWMSSQGMPDNIFYKNCILYNSDRQILFGTYDGVIAFPDSIRMPNVLKSKMIFSNLRIGGVEQNAGLDFDNLDLDYNERQISLIVSNLNYDNPHVFLYSWRLEGSGETWTVLSRERLIRYMLNPGKYRLVVRAYNSADYKLMEERIVTIKVGSPWWLSIPALIFYALLVLAFIYGIYTFLIYKNKRRMAEDKVSFFIQTAHEIRTPLTLVKAPLEEISRNENLSEKGQKNIQIAMRNANDLLILTGDLLNVERLKMHNQKMEISQADLNSYMQELMIPFQLYAKTKKLSLTYSSTSFDIQVWIDRSRMDSIMQNIINNALKYTPEGGSIEVRCRATETSWSVSVSDNGIGIPAEEQSRLTEMYFRSSNADKQATGTGVGLHLVQRLVQEHKGNMAFVSEEGKGTTFTLTFPIDIGEAARRKSVKVRKAPQSAPVVLVVEDNNDLRSFIRDVLSEDYTVHTAVNGQEAYDKVRFLNPDVIVSDVMMPKMRGDELCRCLKSEVETSHIPIILLTALVDRDSVVSGLSTMADAYLTKPFNTTVLKALINNVIANRKNLRKLYANIRENAMTDSMRKLADSFNAGKESTDEHLVSVQPNELDMKFMTDINSIISREMGNCNFTVDTLCMELNMSRTSLYNKTKYLTGYAPADFIRLRRLEHSRELLLSSAYSITEISEKCGFSDPKYFREVFRKNYGESPSLFRNNTTHRNKDI